MQTFSSLIFLLPISTVFNCQKLINGFVLPHQYVALAAKWKQGKCWTIDTNTALAVTYSRNDDAFDIEAVRKQLESLVTAGNDCNPSRSKGNEWSLDAMKTPASENIFDVLDKDANDFQAVAPSPLTAIDRERREFEIELLSDLANGDASIAELWKLWFSERGPQAASRLYEADDLINRGPDGWEKAESILLEVTREYGVTWAEPSNRLATLYYLQGKLDAAEKFCRIVLAVKPWHFGALSGLVMVFAALQDTENARQWAAARLPSFAPSGPNRRRTKWVHDAIEQANAKLRASEEALRSSFGCADAHVAESYNGWKPIEQKSESEWQ